MNEVLPFATTWLDLKSIMLSEINDKYYISLICRIYTIKQMNNNNKSETDSQI